MNRNEYKALPEGTSVIICHPHYKGVSGKVVRYYDSAINLGTHSYVIESEDSKSNPPLKREMTLIEEKEFEVVKFIPVVKPLITDSITKADVDEFYSPISLIEHRIDVGIYVNTAYKVSHSDVITKENRANLQLNFRKHESDLINLFKKDIVLAYSYAFDVIDAIYLEQLMDYIWTTKGEDDTLDDILETFNSHIIILDGFRVIKG